MKKVRTFNMFFTGVFKEKKDTLPKFHTPSENTMDSISFIVDNIKRKLKELNPYKSAGVDRLQLHP